MLLDSHKDGHGIKSRTSQNVFTASCRRHVVIIYFTKNYCTEVEYFLKIYYHISLNDPILSCSSVIPTSQVHASAIFILPIIGN
jgi:hypothetical protein